jgi:hypothetical protein
MSSCQLDQPPDLSGCARSNGVGEQASQSIDPGGVVQFTSDADLGRLGPDQRLLEPECRRRAQPTVLETRPNPVLGSERAAFADRSALRAGKSFGCYFKPGSEP